MNRLLNLINAIRYAGVDETAPLNKKRTIIIVNTLALVITSLCIIISASLWITARQPMISGVGLLQAAIYFAIPVLNHFHRHNAATFILFIIQSASAMYYGAILGDAINIEALAVFLCGASFLIIKSAPYRWGTIILVLLMTFLLKIVWQNQLLPQLPLNVVNRKLIYLFATGAVLAMNGAVLYFYERAINKNNRELEVSVEERTDMLAKANKYKTIYLNGISHDFRNQINPLHGILRELVWQIEEKGEPENISVPSELIHILYSSSRNMIDMTTDVLDMSKIEAGKFDKPNYTVFTLYNWLNLLVDSYKRAAVLKGLRIETDFRQPVPGRIRSDKALLTRAVSNLLSNAIKHTPKNTTISVSTSISENRLIIDVADEGPGISIENQEHIFDAFISTSRVGEGTGLGLSMAKTFIEELQGTLTINSMPGRGSTFTINIPLEETADAATSEDNPAALTFEQFSGANVLLIEDDYANKRLTELQLQRVGCNCYHAETAQQGLETAREILPDLILLDYSLPDKTGFEFIEMIRNDITLLYTPIILVSGEMDPEIIEKARYTANGFVPKPVKADLLYQQISRYLSKRIPV